MAGSGMVIVCAASIEDARAIGESAPFHKAGLRAGSVTGWRLNEGSFSVRVRHSAREFTIL